LFSLLKNSCLKFALIFFKRQEIRSLGGSNMNNFNFFCIHGHFYQPPRFDPWLDEVLPEGSAAPFANWNERITRESYEPLAFVRRLNQSSRAG